MKRVVITYAEVKTPFGDRRQSWQRLCAGESAMRQVTHFDVAPYATQKAACICDLSSGKGGSRLDGLLKTVLADLPPLPAETELLLASIKGRIDLIRPGLAGDRDALDRLEPQSLLEDLLQWLELSCGENVHAACASATVALGQGAARIAAGRTRSVLVVAADLVSELVFSGFAALKGLSTSDCRPFDRRRDGLLLGEGAAVLLLTDFEMAQRLGWPVLAELVGWGCAGDAHHITAPARDGSGLVAAIEQALKRAGVAQSAVTAINAHGTGTIYNDAMELVAFERLFAGRSLPVNSLKGALGHTLGAAGAIEAALMVSALQQGFLPPTWGCTEPEDTVLRVGKDILEFAPGLLLSTNSGFGGINAALLLRRGDI